jgi:hypothetical protein
LVYVYVQDEETRSADMDDGPDAVIADGVLHALLFQAGDEVELQGHVSNPTFNGRVGELEFAPWIYRYLSILSFHRPQICWTASVTWVVDGDMGYVSSNKCSYCRKR